jgi:hypothetical protein
VGSLSFAFVLATIWFIIEIQLTSGNGFFLRASLELSAPILAVINF